MGVTITRLSLSQFRNHADVVMTPHTGLNVLAGENGAGKTNVLEALSMLVPGRGLRGAALEEMARQTGPGGFGVAGRLGDVDISTGTQASAPNRRVVRVNGAAAATTELGDWLSMVWITPAMDRLFLDSAGGRRRFLDRLTLALNPAHARHSNRYDAAMRQRNRLLAEERPADPQWLTALEAQMVEHGLAIAAARVDLVAALSDRLMAQPQGVFARAGIALDGWQVDPDFAETLRKTRSRDAAARRALSGPHLSDLLVQHRDKGQAAALCSTGEQKALLLNIVLAHADLVEDHHGRRPILLLDEVAAHLDPGRRAALFDRLDARGGQVWMTGTEAALFEGSRSKFFTLSEGRIAEGDFADRPDAI
jgi:DNA replication and repair protein RecF